MTSDAQGLTVTGADHADIAAIDAFVHGLLAYDLGIVNIRDAPHKPVMVCVFTGVLHLLAETRGAEATALPWRDAAHAARAGVTPREDQWIGVLDHWCAGDIQATVAALDALVLAYPRDLAALKLLHYHHFNRGEFAGMLRAALHVQRTVGDVPYLGGMLAFAYEQLHLLDAAEAAARTGLALEPGDPWAQHALAHVWLTRGRIDEGLAALEGWSPGWTGLNSFMVTHLWWHLALFHLSKGHFDRALAIYDDHAWGHDRTYSQDQVGAVSLLARLDMAGIAVGDRWADLGTWLAARADDAALPFLAVQYAYGLARAGRPEADRLVGAIAARADDPDPVWRAAALPLAQGLVAHARGEFARARDLLDEAVPRLAHLGGSHAQRDLFALVLLDAQVRSGALGDAQQALELRRVHDPLGVPLNTALARVYDDLGLPDLATKARARIAA